MPIDEGCDRRPEELADHRLRHEEAAVVEKRERADLHALPRHGHQPQHAEIPDEDVQQQRNVAEDLDIDRREAAHDEIRRQPADADDEAEDRRRDDAEDRDQERVQQADEIDVEIGRRALVVGDQRLADVEPGRIAEEAEPRGDVRLAEIVEHVLDADINEIDDDSEKYRLIDPSPDLRIVEDRNPGRADVPRNVLQRHAASLFPDARSSAPRGAPAFAGSDVPCPSFDGT